MIKNYQHNIIHQLSETLDSLWRMDQYLEDARKEGYQEGIEFWNKYRESLEKQIETLKEELKKTAKNL